MTTLVVVKKAGMAVMAADTMVTFGDTRLGNRFEANSKVFAVEAAQGQSFIGMAALPKEDLKLHSKDEVYDTFLKLHPLLKETFFLQTKEDDNDPYESMQFTSVIANSSGIYGLYSYREIFEFKEFWGIGTGRGFALGAMHAAWDKCKTAKEVALAGLNAGCEFDKNSGGPIELFAVKLKT
jgi:ATP-dependent HslUV protease, peptidase subunit HslV